jgi:hypothetical protein
MFPEFLQRLLTVRSLADHEHVRLILDDGCDAFPHQWMVVHT